MAVWGHCASWGGTTTPSTPANFTQTVGRLVISQNKNYSWTLHIQVKEFLWQAQGAQAHQRRLSFEGSMPLT